MSREFHALCLAAPRSGEGKTTVSMALMRALSRRGLRVQGFKCGPDYIDPTFHAQATGHPSYNMDTWMMGHAGVRALWAQYTQNADIALCEGVMGLFDGRSPSTLAGSTADCALALGIPVIMVFNARGMAASVAALAAGFVQHAARKGLCIAGFIANNVGSPRHTALLREALHAEHLPPLLGAFPRSAAWTLPERQLGLLPAEELALSAHWLDDLARAVEEHVDVDTLLALTRSPCPDPVLATPLPATSLPATQPRRMGIAKDRAFCFYYKENERALQRRGWTLVPFSPLTDTALPDNLDAVYLGGGYPEVFAKELSHNTSMRQAIHTFAEQGGEIYAECGGFMYLCSELVMAENTAHAPQRWPMCDVLKATANMGSRIRSLGYRDVQLLHDAPFNLEQQRFRGHEFHWSTITLHQAYAPLYTVCSSSGEQPAGVVSGAVKAGYVHLYWGEHAPICEQQPASTQQRGQVVLLNGPSSAGKTTMAEALQTLLLQTHQQHSLVLSVDHMLRASSGGYETVLAGLQHTGLPLIEAFHASIAAAAQAGALVIVDHVIGENPLWLADLLARLQGIPLLAVQVHCDMEILRQREAGRKDRTPDLPNAERQSQNIHTPLPNEIWINTAQATPVSCAMTLVNLLNGSTDQSDR